MRDCNDQQRIEQEMEQSFIEEMKWRIQEDIESVKQKMKENNERL